MKPVPGLALGNRLSVVVQMLIDCLAHPLLLLLLLHRVQALRDAEQAAQAMEARTASLLQAREEEREQLQQAMKVPQGGCDLGCACTCCRHQGGLDLAPACVA